MAERLCSRRILLDMCEVKGCEGEDLVDEIWGFNSVAEGDVKDVGCLTAAKNCIGHGCRGVMEKDEVFG
jgi:hypothetical protein